MRVNLVLGAILNYLYNNLITHIPFHLLRITFLRLFNKNIHSTAIILMHTRILNFWKIHIGPRSVINQYCLLDCRRFKVYIENDVDIGPYTKIWTLGHDPNSATHEVKGGDVLIQDHAWIASNVTILPNITIERGGIVAASAVVHKTVKSLDIVAGNPCRVVKKRENTLEYELVYKPILE